jgi:hypothetical protein
VRGHDGRAPIGERSALLLLGRKLLHCARLRLPFEGHAGVGGGKQRAYNGGRARGSSRARASAGFSSGAARCGASFAVGRPLRERLQRALDELKRLSFARGQVRRHGVVLWRDWHAEAPGRLYDQLQTRSFQPRDALTLSTSA